MTEQLLLETALAELEAGVDAALGNASTLVRHLKKLRSVAQSGDLREISKVLGEITQSTGEVAAATSALAFEFDTNSYFPEKYLRELEAAAKERGLSAFPRDGKLYCYPLLVRIKAAERVVEIGRRTERGIRPSALAATLQKLQSKPTRFKPADFLKLLYNAYRHCAGAAGGVLTFAAIYDVLTLMPGASKEYTKDDFAADLYLLDSSGVNQMSDGTLFQFAGSTGTRNAAATFVCIGADGAEKRYYGISFGGDAS